MRLNRFLKPLSIFVFVSAMILQRGSLAAQIQAEIVLSQDHYLAGEPIKVAVKVTNFSGKTLKLGETQEWLQFAVEGQNNHIINRFGDVPVIMPFDLENSSVATRRVDIAPYFELSRSGRYKLTATISIPQSGKQITTRPAYLDIMSGSRLWEQEFGYSRPGNPTSETRKYILLLISQKSLRKLYIRVADQDETKIFRTFAIGTLVSFGSPDHQIDSSSRLHILSQYGARTFNYCVVDPEGELVVRNTYEYDNSFRPTLGISDEGQIMVKGGIRRKTEADIPDNTQTAAAPATTSPKESRP